MKICSLIIMTSLSLILPTLCQHATYDLLLTLTVQWAVCSAYSMSTARLEHSGLRKKKGGGSTSNHKWTDFGERAKLISLCTRDCMNSSPSLWSRSRKPAWLLWLSPVLRGNPRVLGSYKNFTQYKTKKRCSFLAVSTPMKAFFFSSFWLL